VKRTVPISTSASTCCNGWSMPSTLLLKAANVIGLGSSD
jgi:hypothetical protein